VNCQAPDQGHRDRVWGICPYFSRSSASDGFGTTKFSLPFKLLQLDRHEKPELVEAAGIEPAGDVSDTFPECDSDCIVGRIDNTRAYGLPCLCENIKPELMAWSPKPAFRSICAPATFYWCICRFLASTRGSQSKWVLRARPCRFVGRALFRALGPSLAGHDDNERPFAYAKRKPGK